MALNEEYQENPECSAWVMAHAGSGKTYALVRRVIALMLRGAKPQTIWCVTYTNNAAAEIEARILSQLNDFAQMSDRALTTELGQYLNRSISSDDITRIRTLSENLAMPKAGIVCTTMHGLCQQLLRVFALELGLLPDFSVLTAEAARELLLQAIEDVFSRAIDHRSGALYEATQHVSSTIKYPAAKQKLRAMLQRPEILKTLIERYGLGEQNDGQTLGALVYQACDALEDYAKSESDILQQAHRDTPEAIRDIADAYAHGKGKDREKAPLINGWLAQHESAKALAAAFTQYTNLFFTTQGELRKKLFNKGTLEEGSALERALMNELARVQQLQERLANLALAKDSKAMLILAVAALDRYAQLKAEPGLLDFDDLLQLALKLVSDTAMLGHVMQKLDYRLEHILLDEAQDTSPMQWQMLSHIIHELVDTPARTGRVPRSVFVVGDIKQSIYSFQGAAPEMMHQQCEALQALYRHHNIAFNMSTLPVARRSVPGVLQLVDHICAHPDVQEGLMEQDIAHLALRQNAPATMAVFPLVEGEALEKPSDFTMPTEHYFSAKAQDKLASQIANEVRGWLDTNRVIAATGKPVQPGDIMIIVRNRGKLVPALIRALQQQHIPVAGIDRLQLSEHVLVQDILALIRWIYQPNDDLSLARVLRSPLVGLSEEALFNLAHSREASLFSALEESETFAPILAFLKCAKSQSRQSIYGWLNDLFYAHSLAERYRARLGEEVVEVIDALMDHAAALEGTPESNLLYFLRQMQHGEQVVQRANEGCANQLRILTVHGAKGLEAPIVILADTTSTPNLQKEVAYEADMPDAGRLLICQLSESAKHSPALTSVKQNALAGLQREYYRALYVAVTRARDELYVFGMKPISSSCTPWHQVIADAMAQFNEAITDDDGVLWVRQLADDSQMPVAQMADHESSKPALPKWVRQSVPAVNKKLVLTPSLVGASHEGFESAAPPTATDAAANNVLASDARAFGIALHGLLQWMLPSSDAALIKRAVANLDLPESDKLLIQKTLTHLFADQEINALLSKPAISERAISVQLDNQQQTYDVFGVIDRLIVTPDEMMVLDYKTSLNPPPADRLPMQYLLQMKLYQLACEKLYPSKPVRAALLWTHTARLDWLGGALNEISFEDITENLSHKSADFLDVPLHAA